MPSPSRFSDVKKQLEAAGYRLVRISGSHHIFDRPGGPLLSIPVHQGKVKPYYVREIQKLTEPPPADEQVADEAEEGQEGPGS